MLDHVLFHRTDSGRDLRQSAVQVDDHYAAANRITEQLFEQP